MALKRPTLLIPNFGDRQLEVFAKTVQSAILNLYDGISATAQTVDRLPRPSPDKPNPDKPTPPEPPVTGALRRVMYAEPGVGIGMVVVSTGGDSLPPTAEVADAETANQGVLGVAVESNPDGTMTYAGYGDVLLLDDPDGTFAGYNGPVWLGASGGLAQTPPPTGAAVFMGWVADGVMLVAPTPPQTQSFRNALAPLDGADGATRIAPWPVLTAVHEIPEGYNYVIPAGTTAFFSAADGLTLDGDIVIDGTLDWAGA